MVDQNTVIVLVQIGEAVLPLAEAAIADVVSFAKSHGGNAEVIAQLTGDAATIGADQAQLAQEAAALPPPTPPADPSGT